MFEVRNLSAGYQDTKVLFGASLTVNAGELVTLLGRNRMGKSRVVRAILGMLPPTVGTISFGGVDLAGLAPFRIARRGIGLVPKGQCVCDNLTVEENLRATARASSDRATEGLKNPPVLVNRTLKLRSTCVGSERYGGYWTALVVNWNCKSMPDTKLGSAFEYLLRGV